MRPEKYSYPSRLFSRKHRPLKVSRSAKDLSRPNVVHGHEGMNYTDSLPGNISTWCVTNRSVADYLSTRQRWMTDNPYYDATYKCVFQNKSMVKVQCT